MEVHLDGRLVVLALASRQEGCVPADVIGRVKGVLVARVAVAAQRRRMSVHCNSHLACVRELSCKLGRGVKCSVVT
jgi:hypothetical protein